MEFVDTNVFLRALLQDDPTKSPKSQTLFDKAIQGKLELWTTEWVIGEIIWVLHSFYEKPKSFIIDSIAKILNTQGLFIHNEDLVIEALSLYKNDNLDYVDAVNSVLVQEEGVKKVYSYDKHFNRISWLKRREP